MNAESPQLDSRLKCLVPAATQIDRDALLYAAGARAAAAQAAGQRRTWQVLAGGATLLMICALTTLIAVDFGEAPQTQVAVRTHSDMPVAEQQPRSDELSFQPRRQSNILRLQDIDSWTREDFRAAGISVERWEHLPRTQEIMQDGLRLQFDTSRAPESSSVSMTAHFVPEGASSVTSAVGVQKQRDQRWVELLLTATGADVDDSRVEIVIWEDAVANAEASGYRVSFRSLIELVDPQFP